MGACFKVIAKCMSYEKHDKDAITENEAISLRTKGKGYLFQVLKNLSF